MRLRAVRLVTAACLACAGCGVPGAGTTQVPETAVPYRLLEPAPSPSLSPSAGSPPSDGPPTPVEDPASALDLAARGPTTYLLDADERLRPVVLEPGPLDGSLVGGTGGTALSGPSPSTVATRLVRRLSAGPTPSQRDAGLSTALAPGVPVTLVDVIGNTARVTLRQPERDPAAERLPLAVGQVVLTLSSAPGVERVQFLSDGEPAAVPVPSGARRSTPVTAADYAPLLTTGG